MTHPSAEPVVLSALDGREPLGFMAALGLTRLLAAHDVALSWDESSGRAQIHSSFSDVNEIVRVAVETVRAASPTELLPGLAEDLVPPKVGSRGADPAWIGLDRYCEISASRPDVHEWIASVWTDLTDDKEGRCARSPFTAPSTSGQETMRSLFDTPRSIVLKAPERWLGDALSSWVRMPGFSGGGLDSRALRDTAELQEAEDSEYGVKYGVPGATYLALLAMPLFRIGGNGVLAVGDSKLQRRTRRSAVAWFTATCPGRDVFAWSLWRRPLGEAAIRVLLDHPDVGRAVSQRLHGTDLMDPGRLRALDVWAIAAASRRKSAGSKAVGFLTQEWVWRTD